VKPKLSIIIPTHFTEYGQQYCLKDVIVSIVHAFGYSDAIEIIVVENPNKTDRVADIIKDACHNRSYNVIHTSCQLGANRARNYGIQLAQSDIIALLDDDCVVGQGWIESILSAHLLYPNAGVIGGSMKLSFLCEKPRWIEGYFVQCLAEVDHGEGVHDLSGVTDPYVAMIVSGNLTFKKAIYDKTSGFDVNLGYIGDNCMAQDEIEFIRECTIYGKPGRLYVGGMMVYHQIPKTRLCVDYFIKRSYGDGYNYARLICNYRKDVCVEDAVVEQLLPRWSQHFHHMELSNLRQTIAHEESTRIYIYHLMKCKTAFFKGFEDFMVKHNIPSYVNQYQKGFLMNMESSNTRRTW
jgi:glycosyltransferase involved in cell wall biosynthesis